MQATGMASELERGLLEQTDVDDEALAGARELCGADMPGERRSLRVPLIDPEVEGGLDEHGHYVRCAFELPKGAFATVVMREIIKHETTDRPRQTRKYIKYWPGLHVIQLSEAIFSAYFF